MRTARQQVVIGALVSFGVLIAAIPLYGRKKIDNPDKIGHRTVAHKGG